MPDKLNSFEPLNSLKEMEPEMTFFYLGRFSGHPLGLRVRCIAMQTHHAKACIVFPMLACCIIHFIQNFGVSCRFHIKLLRKLPFQ